jgi:hypothetical protein
MDYSILMYFSARHAVQIARFKNSLLTTVSGKGSTGYLSDGSDLDPWNLIISSNGMPCADGIARCAKPGFVCMPLDLLAIPREKVMPNDPESAFHFCEGPRTHSYRRKALPSVRVSIDSIH